MPKWSTEAKNLDDDEWKIYENLTQRNKVTEEHSQQQAEKPTAGTANSRQKSTGEKSIPSSRRESKEQKEQCQLQAETYEVNNVSKKEVGPMTRNKDTESHRRMAAEQELKVAEKTGEHQVQIGTQIEVEKQKAAELRKPGTDCQEIA